MHEHILKTRLFKYIENFISKNCKFSDTKFWYFSYFCSNIDCGYSLKTSRQGGSNEYPQSMFLSRNTKNNVYSGKPQFYYIKVGFKGVNNYISMFSWWGEPQRQKTYFRTCAPSNDSDQPAYSRNMIKISIGLIWVAKYAKFPQANNEDSDRIERMRRLI